MLGSSSNFVQCDYGETASGVLNCSKPLAAQGVQPNGTTGGYAPETFPLGVSETHPQFLSGTCSATGGVGTACTFPNSFAFADTTYNCTITAQGTSPASVSYQKSSTTQITVYGSATATYSYICVR